MSIIFVSKPQINDILRMSNCKMKKEDNFAFFIHQDVAIVSSNFAGDPVEDTKITFLALKKSDPRIKPVYFHPDDFKDEDPLV